VREKQAKRLNEELKQRIRDLEQKTVNVPDVNRKEEK